VAGQQAAQALGVDATIGERGVGAAPAAPVGWFQAQVRQGCDGPGDAEQRVVQLD
jgi:hypothetical protein